MLKYLYFVNENDSTQKIPFLFSNNVCNFKVFYSVKYIGDTSPLQNEIVYIGLHKDLLETQNISIAQNVESIYLLFQYETDIENVNSDVCNEFFYNYSKNARSYFLENGYFIMGKKTNNVLSYTEFTYSNSNNSITERGYGCPIIPFTIENYSVNKTQLDVTISNTITLTADDGYFFDSAPRAQLVSVISDSWFINFNLNEDSTQASYIFTDSLSATFDGNYKIQAITTSCIRQTVISDKYGLISIYKPDSNFLKRLPTKMLYTYNMDGTRQLVDLSQYITAFMTMPLDVAIFDTKSVTLNGMSISEECGYINDNIVVLDFGNVEINGFYNNSIDYNNTDIELYLPFYDIVKIDTKKYMNKIINLTYKVDLFTGDFIIILTIDNIVSDSFSGNIAIHLPYITKTENGLKVQNNYNSNNKLLIDRVPKIKISSNNINNDVNIKTNSYTQLTNLTGFNKIDNVEISANNILLDDIEKIKNELLNGIIF